MAIILGGDYSYNPPTPAELEAAGWKFACRYLVGRAPKKLTADEVQALGKVGIAIVSNYESTEGFMLEGGFDKGVAVAKAAWATHKAVGGPDRRPIYFSADSDPGGWTAAQWTSFDGFLDGAASVLGGKQGVGVYGGTLALQAARAGGSCGWFWQALGWRRGVWLDWVHIQQYDNGNPLGSGLVDYDRALTADFGQWGAQQEDDMPGPADWTDTDWKAFWTAQPPVKNPATQHPNTLAEIAGYWPDGGLNGIRNDTKAIRAAVAAEQGSVETAVASTAVIIDLVQQAEGALAGGIADLRSALLGAIAAQPGMSDEQAQAAADRIVAFAQERGVELVRDAVVEAFRTHPLVPSA